MELCCRVWYNNIITQFHHCERRYPLMTTEESSTLASFNGRTLDFQSNDESSILSASSKCMNCGNDKGKNAKFCCLTCANRHNVVRGLTVKIQTCKFCSKPFEKTCKSSKKVFCSHSCAASFNNAIIPHNKKNARWCSYCNNLLRSRNKGETCSLACAKAHRRKIYIDRWKQGLEDGNCREKVHKFVREWIFFDRLSRCEQCGWSEVNVSTGLIPLQVEHIDGNWRNTTPSNLKLLCPSCHSLTATYGSANRGKGRPGRQEWRNRQDTLHESTEISK